MINHTNKSPVDLLRRRVAALLIVVVGMTLSVGTIVSQSSSPPASSPVPEGSPVPVLSSTVLSPIEVEGAISEFVVALVDEEGELVGGACWKLLQEDEAVTESCDNQPIEQSGFNGYTTFLNVATGVYTLTLSEFPDGIVRPDDRDIEIIEQYRTTARVEVTRGTNEQASPIASLVDMATPSVRDDVASMFADASPESESPIVASPEPATSDATPSQSTPVATPSIRQGIISTNGSVLNCRAEASADADVIASLEDGSIITITGEEIDGWLPVKCDDEDGWISSLFVEIATP